MGNVLAFDTSCYTTSAAFWENGRMAADRRIPLSVPEGRKGLRQSEAVFQHLRNIPLLLEEFGGFLKSVDVVAASDAPRRLPGSYLPVFTVGRNFARSIASLADKPVYFCSHQEGHLAAGAWSCGEELPPRFLAGHFSGGTTEVLAVEESSAGYCCRILAATSDLHAGQFVDRIGVAMGLPFPAGPALERMAEECGGGYPALPFSKQKNRISFSGPATAALRLIEQGVRPAEIAKAVFHCIGRMLGEIIRDNLSETEAGAVLLVGGVMANGAIQDYLKENLPGRLLFAEKKYCSDNAAGVALLGGRFA
ncbi:MAG: hypothetical protein ACM3WV_11720 [Bacillota bacterium]